MSQLSPSVQAVLELFQGPFADLRFADVNAAALAELASGVESAASALAEQEARVTELRQTLTDRHDALLLLAQRALAYARVYAEHDPALTEQLSRIALPKANKPRKANAKAAGADPTPVEAEPSAAQEPVAAEARATQAAEEATEPSIDSTATDAPSTEADSPRAPARTGKRRSRAEASSSEIS